MEIPMHDFFYDNVDIFTSCPEIAYYNTVKLSPIITFIDSNTYFINLNITTFLNYGDYVTTKL